MTLLFAVRIYAATLFLVLAAGYLLRSRNDHLSRWFAALCIADFCYLILGAALRQSAVPLDLGWLIYPFATCTVLGAALFMVFIWVLTKDGSRFPAILVAAIALQVGIELLNMPCREDGLCLPNYSLDQGAGLWLQRLADGLELTFQILGIYWAARGIRADLVEQRRRLRLYCLLPLFVSVAVLEFGPLWMASAATQAAVYFMLHTLIFAAIATVLVYLSLDTGFQYLREIAAKPARRPPGEPGPSAFDGDAEVFERVFVDGKAYLHNELSVAGLARKMSIPQYRLRRLIHHQYGFRNFNDLLNRYRVEEFCRLAADKDNDRLPITSLALEAGFNSVSTFNQAFRRLKGTTPSEFRAQLA